jgi:hypothetical protein
MFKFFQELLQQKPQGLSDQKVAETDSADVETSKAETEHPYYYMALFKNSGFTDQDIRDIFNGKRDNEFKCIEGEAESITDRRLSTLLCQGGSRVIPYRIFSSEDRVEVLHRILYYLSSHDLEHDGTIRNSLVLYIGCSLSKAREEILKGNLHTVIAGVQAAFNGRLHGKKIPNRNFDQDFKRQFITAIKELNLEEELLMPDTDEMGKTVEISDSKAREKALKTATDKGYQVITVSQGHTLARH